MASIRDVGTPGVPLATPPLTEWQKAVRDALDSSDTTVDARVAQSLTEGKAYSDQVGATAIADANAYTDAEIAEQALTGQAYVDQVVTVSATGPTAPPARDGLLWVMVVAGEPEPVPTIYVATAGAWVPVISGPGALDIPTADGLYVNLTGDTMLAPLAGPDPTEANHYVTRSYYENNTSPGVLDHGELTGLADDDHPQYLTTARGDARYPAKADLAPFPIVTVSASAPASPALGDLWIVP